MPTQRIAGLAMSKRMGRSAQFIGRVKARGAQVQGRALSPRHDTTSRLARSLDIVRRNAVLLERLDDQMARFADSLGRGAEGERARILARRLGEKLRFTREVEQTTMQLLAAVPGLTRTADITLVPQSLLSCMRSLAELRAALDTRSQARPVSQYRRLAGTFAPIEVARPATSRGKGGSNARRPK